MDGVGAVGAIALVAVLSVVVLVAVLRARYDGRLRSKRPPGRPVRRTSAEPVRALGAAGSLAAFGIATPANRVTVVQFSGQFCGSCEQVRTLVARILRDSPDIGHVEVDVAEHIKAVRALDIRRTPTLIIVDRHGVPVHRASGMPREAELREAVAELAART